MSRMVPLSSIGSAHATPTRRHLRASCCSAPDTSASDRAGRDQLVRLRLLGGLASSPSPCGGPAPCGRPACSWLSSAAFASASRTFSAFTKSLSFLSISRTCFCPISKRSTSAFGASATLFKLRAEEDAGQRIVVLRGDRVELVIVAACARDGEREEAANQRINAVVQLLGNDLVIALVVLRPAGQKKPTARPMLSMNASDPSYPSGRPRSVSLMKLVVWQVGIERDSMTQSR